LSYKGRTYPHPEEVLPRDSYISICVPTYCRPFYLKKLLDSLQEHADMPYEVIVHDDGSPKHLQDEVFAMRDRISILSFNTGLNQGLPAASNHCISQASSKYVLFLNDDCFFVKPCLQEICNVLDKEYVGVISPANDPGPFGPTERMVTKATKYALGGYKEGAVYAVSNYLGGGSCIAFRKSVWQEVGGWDERSTSGQADNVFIYKILRAGYWKALLEGKDRVKVGNFVYGDDYKPTQGYSKGNDCSFPRMFRISEQDQQRLAYVHREACQYWVDGERTIDEGNGRSFYDDRPNPVAGLNDINYWGEYFLDLFGHKHSHSVLDVNWELAKRHGQDKWKEQILNDAPKA
jgi:glycosyltransferase involved in cell wall biosynthesis